MDSLSTYFQIPSEYSGYIHTLANICGGTAAIALVNQIAISILKKNNVQSEKLYVVTSVILGATTAGIAIHLGMHHLQALASLIYGLTLTLLLNFKTDEKIPTERAPTRRTSYDPYDSAFTGGMIQK